MSQARNIILLDGLVDPSLQLTDSADTAEMRINLLHLESAMHNAWLSARLSPACATLPHILFVLGSNDVFTCDRLIHDRLLMWEESVEAPVEQTGSREGVHVTDSEAGKVVSTIGCKQDVD